MSLSCFLIPVGTPLEKRGTVILTGREAHHLLHARHLGPGSFVRLIDGFGRVAKAEVVWAKGSQAGLNIMEVRRQQKDCLPIELIVALLKGNRMDWMIQKATELGVQSIHPVISRYTVVKVDNEKAGRRLGRWKEIARQALKQCRGSLLPAIYPPVPLKEALEKIPHAGAKILLWESERLRSLFSAWRDQARALPAIIVVGPEGGLSREEVLACKNAGFLSATMGLRTLRSETAAIGAVAALAAIMLSDLEE